ncbi:MAG: PA0069 family radical SAM protein [Pseudomonadota bacterium]|nr:PA0069 family radical SAM protein [Pseudomonadota bacterium]
MVLKFVKGRGAISNHPGRFEQLRRIPYVDDWKTAAEQKKEKIKTEITAETARRIITTNRSPDIDFDTSINPYKGCEHGCIYCFARPTHAYLGLSAGFDFESRIFYKPEAAEVLAKEIQSPNYKCRVLALGTNTDPYQPIERELKITRRLLKVLLAHNHPVVITTKSSQIARDLDILKPMAQKGLLQVNISLTTLDQSLSRTLEPGCPTPARRVDTLKQLSDAGIETGVMLAPVIPVLNDPEIEAILEVAAKSGAVAAGYVLLRLPLEIKDLFREWLEVHYPLKANHILNVIRSTRQGQLYVSEYGERMDGSGPYAKILHHRYTKTCRKLGLNKIRKKLNTDLFLHSCGQRRQLRLFS